ncbi:MAG: hypothetical protein U0Q16_06965 [Bryobacteraceae bacterium]
MAKPTTRSILVICPDRKMLGELAPLISQHLPLTPVIEITHYPNRKEISEGVAATSPGLCFLEVNSGREQGLAVLNDLTIVSPSTQVVALLSDNDPDLILTCLRQGATEFLLSPLNAEQLNPVLDRLAQLSAANPMINRGGGKVFSTLPVKGACGASTIASSLAFQWRRLGSKKVLLADMDPLAGTLSFLLKIKSSYSFNDALVRAQGLDGDLWKGLVTTVNGVDVLLSPDNPTGGEPSGDPGQVIDFCRHAYDTITLDLGNPYTEWSQTLAMLSDEVLLVTTNELPSLRAAQRVLSLLEKVPVDRSRIRLVVNRYNPDVGLTDEAIETALGTDVFHLIPSDYESVQRALVDGKPIAPGSGFGKSLNILAEELHGKKQTQSPGKKSWTGFFSALVRR